MKVIHVLKRIETIDQDIKELRKLEKSLQRDKSFTQPIFITIEKQINILLGERIKLLELQIKNPPENLVEEIESEEIVEPLIEQPTKTKSRRKTKKTTKQAEKQNRIKEDVSLQEEEIKILTQDDIDKKIEAMKEDKIDDLKEKENIHDTEKAKDHDYDVKLIDIALEKGTLNEKEVKTQKKKIKFFKDNFPGGEY